MVSRGHAKIFHLLLAGLCIGAGIGMVIVYGFNWDFLTSPGGGMVDQAGLPSPFVGNRAPDFELQTLSGSTIRLSGLQGKVVILNFWATWCAPCQQEMPLLQARADQYQSSLVILGINYDEPANLVQDFVTKLDITFPILLDPGSKIQNLYRVRGYPTSVIIDKSGVIRIVHIGELSSTMLDNYLKKLGIGS